MWRRYSSCKSFFVVFEESLDVLIYFQIVMSEAESAEEFVMAYSRLLPDSDSSELQKVLEMKALRRQEQTNIIQLYKTRIEGQTTAAEGLFFSSHDVEF